MALKNEMIHALSRVVVGSIGPVTSAELQLRGITVDMEPSTSDCDRPATMQMDFRLRCAHKSREPGPPAFVGTPTADRGGDTSGSA